MTYTFNAPHRATLSRGNTVSDCVRQRACSILICVHTTNKDSLLLLLLLHVFLNMSILKEKKPFTLLPLTTAPPPSLPLNLELLILIYYF